MGAMRHTQLITSDKNRPLQTLTRNMDLTQDIENIQRRVWSDKEISWWRIVRINYIICSAQSKMEMEDIMSKIIKNFKMVADKDFIKCGSKCWTLGDCMSHAHEASTNHSGVS